MASSSVTLQGTKRVAQLFMRSADTCLSAIVRVCAPRCCLTTDHTHSHTGHSCLYVRTILMRYWMERPWTNRYLIKHIVCILCHIISSYVLQFRGDVLWIVITQYNEHRVVEVTKRYALQTNSTIHALFTLSAQIYRGYVYYVNIISSYVFTIYPV